MSGSDQPITTISEFLDWVKEISDGRTILYRGLSMCTHSVEAALVRRLKKACTAATEEQFQDLFIAASANIIDSAIIKGYPNQDSPKMADLEIMAELQHYGAATCLIDFTRNPLVALWFACRSNPEKPGKIVALDSGDDKMMHSTSDNIGNAEGTIHERMKKMLGEIKEDGYNDGKNIRIWEPAHQNKRITAQQSVFVFGPAQIDNAIYRKLVVDEQAKESLLKELRAYGISAESLFCDFDGFARILNAHEKPYPDSAEGCYRIGEQHFNNDNYDLAIKFYDMALSHKTPYKKAFYKRGRAYSFQEQWDKAIADYDEAILISDNKDAHTWRGIAKANLGHLSAAISDFSKTIELSPQNAEAYHSRGLAKISMGDYHGAINDYNQVIRLNPQNAEAYNNRGVANANLSNLSAAIDDFNKAFELNPQNAETYHTRGFAKAVLGDHHSAVNDYNKAIELDPQTAETYNNRGIVKAQLGDLPAAIGDFNKAVELNPQNAKAYNNRGVAKGDLGEYQNAIADYNQAIKVDPQYADAYHSRGLVKANMGEHQNAINDYSKVIELDPQNAKAYNNRGVAKGDLGEPQNAIDDFNKTIELDPQNADAYNNRGTAKAALGEPQNAIDDYNKAIEINPQYADAYSNRGLTKAQLSQPNDAVNDYNKAIEINSKNAPAHYNRGLAKLQTGDKEAARTDFLKVRQLDPNIKFSDEIEKFLKETE